jgi:DNA polymerase-3 subunit epsilon
MATYDPADRDRAILWAKNVMENTEKYLIFDTETTGLKYDDEIIQIAIIDLNEKVFLNTLINPTWKKSISRGASNTHGIKKKDLEGAPCFEDICLEIQKTCLNKTVLFFNAEFDMRLIGQSQRKAYIPPIIPKYECAMLQYSKFIGTWNDYRNNYKYQKLNAAEHNALGDCLATLKVLERMTHGRTRYIHSFSDDHVLQPKKIEPIIQKEEKTKWWQFWN